MWGARAYVLRMAMAMSVSGVQTVEPQRIGASTGKPVMWSWQSIDGSSTGNPSGRASASADRAGTTISYWPVVGVVTTSWPVQLSSAFVSWHSRQCASRPSCELMPLRTPAVNGGIGGGGGGGGGGDGGGGSGGGENGGGGSLAVCAMRTLGAPLPSRIAACFTSVSCRSSWCCVLRPHGSRPARTAAPWPKTRAAMLSRVAVCGASTCWSGSSIACTASRSGARRPRNMEKEKGKASDPY